MVTAWLGRLLVAVVLIGTTAASQLLAQKAEYVVVEKIMDDKAIVARENGDRYLIEKGVGCLSLWRYEGKRVVISSPGLFLGVGSRLLIPDPVQECRIWHSELIASGAPVGVRSNLPTTRGPQAREHPFSFYDSRGEAVAYLSPESELTIYLWSGEPVAYLLDESVYGFNGEHLGWLRDGLIFDNDGAVVAAPAFAFRTPVAVAPVRGVRQLKPLRAIREIRPIKPLFSVSWTRLPARAFFLMEAR